MPVDVCRFDVLLCEMQVVCRLEEFMYMPCSLVEMKKRYVLKTVLIC